MKNSPSGDSFERKLIGEKLKEKLKTANRSQNWLGDEAGYDKSTISKIMNDKQPPTLEQIHKIFEAMGLDASFADGTNVAGLFEPEDSAGKEALRAENNKLIQALEGERSKVIEQSAMLEQKEAELRSVRTIKDRLEVELAEAHGRLEQAARIARGQEGRIELLLGHISARDAQIKEQKEQIQRLTNIATGAGLGALVAGIIAAAKSDENQKLKEEQKIRRRR